MSDSDRKREKVEWSPPMSTTSVLVSVEDLIHMAMGPQTKNIVNYKLLQTVLHILARQMRLLEQRVELKISDYYSARAEDEKESEEAAREKAKSIDERRAKKDADRAEREAAKAAKGAAKAEKEVAKTSAKAEKEATKTAKDAAKADQEMAKASAKAEKEAARAEKDSAKADKEAAKASAKAEKEVTKADKEAAKASAKTEKEAAKADKEAAKASAKTEKEAAKADKEAAKASAKTEKEAAKAEREAQKTAEKERKDTEKGLAAEAKEKQKQEKAAAKEQRAASKERPGADEKAGTKTSTKGVGSDTSIVITEAERDKQKVLVVEKGPTTRSASGVSGGPRNIEVVTRSQFELLQELVGELAEKAGPLPMPSLPGNKELLDQLSKGTASLTDMMGAMNVNARVKAAEQAIGRMGGILTQLALAGALPEDIAGQVGEISAEFKSIIREAGGGSTEDGEDVPRMKSVASAASRKHIQAARSRTVATGPSSITTSISSFALPKVTHNELDESIRIMKEDLTKQMQQITAKAITVAENAVGTVKTVAEKLDTAMRLNGRISVLYSQVQDYAEQLSGFDDGIATQMQSFSEQMAQMNMDLKQGLVQLDSVNNNAETAAIMELNERYEGLVTELDNTLHFHQELTSHQGTLGEDLRGLIEAVESLSEQKADRDEVQDGLRDKADNSRLAGLLTEEAFATACAELEQRLHVCHDKFSRQDAVWMQAIKDLKAVTDLKADIIQLLSLRDETRETMLDLNAMCQFLARVLGEPKAAILTRKLNRGSVCGACLAPALMEAEDEGAGAPPRLPAARPRPTGAPAASEELCEQEFKLPFPPDDRGHICHRWVGGSHTMVPQGVVTRAHAQPLVYDAVPTTRFADYGEDGRLYMMEEQLQPCLECNKLCDEAIGTQVDTLPPIEGKSN